MKLSNKQLIFWSLILLYLSAISVGLGNIKNLPIILFGIMGVVLFIKNFTLGSDKKEIVFICLVHPLLCLPISLLHQDGVATYKMYGSLMIFLTYPLVFKYFNLPLNHFLKLFLLSGIVIILFNAFYIHFGGDNLRIFLIVFLTEFLILYDIQTTMLLLMLLAASFYYISYKNNKIGYFMSFIASLGLIAIVLHGTRSIWLGLFLSLIFLPLVFCKKNGFKAIILITLIILGILFATIQYSPVASRVSAIKSDTLQFQQDQKGNTSLGARFFMYKLTLKDFQSSPLTGIGIREANIERCNAHKQGLLDGCHPHAHNAYLQEMSTHGIFGLLGLLFLLIYPLSYFIKSLFTHYTSQVFIAPIMGIILIINSAFGALSDNYLGTSATLRLYYFLCLTLVLYIKDQTNTSNLSIKSLSNSFNIT